MHASDDGNDHPGNNNLLRPENAHRRKGKGRKKVNMAKIESETNRQVTFSKRRGGLFKKASELSTLCGADCALVLFSPGDKPHCFGHPSVEAVINRFLQTGGGVPPPPAGVNSTDMLIMNQQHLVNMEAEVERQKQLRREIDGLVLTQMGDLDFEQLGQLWNMALMVNGEVAAMQMSGASSSSAAAGVYGYGGAAPGFGYPAPPFPPIGDNGMGGYNYVDPSAVVRNDGATGSSNPAVDAPDEDIYGGFPDNFGHPGY